jgi:hypothetical protein
LTALGVDLVNREVLMFERPKHAGLLASSLVAACLICALGPIATLASEWTSLKNPELGYNVMCPPTWKRVQICTEVDPLLRTCPSGMTYDAFQEKGAPVEGVTGTGKKVMLETFITRLAIYNYALQQFGTDPNRTTKDIFEWLMKQLKEVHKDERFIIESTHLAGASATKVTISGSTKRPVPHEMIIIRNAQYLFVLDNVSANQEMFAKFCKSFKPTDR